MNKKYKNRKFLHYNFFPKNRKGKGIPTIFQKKNRRGDIPTTILVIGVIAVLGYAIFSFVYSMSHVRNSFVGIGLVEKLNSQIEEMIFNKQNPTGLYLENKENRGFLFWKKEVVLFSVEYKGKGS